MAVTVEQDRFLVLDDEFRVVEVGAGARAAYGPVLGQIVFEAFPDSEPLLRPHYEQARATGEAVEFAAFYNGYVKHLRVTPSGSDLTITWDDLGVLDVLTLEGLVSSLDVALRALDECSADIERRRGRSRLRVVEAR